MDAPHGACEGNLGRLRERRHAYRLAAKIAAHEEDNHVPVLVRLGDRQELVIGFAHPFQKADDPQKLVFGHVFRASQPPVILLST
ncbi:hypothetical protein [Mesorhizobium sp.]|uniref:hypothetical protein n=1 Tax=Mesorhizobium sp. TaxID=1871066 RepID=UPI0025BEDBC5|nr:hypothetical protein [Mesorhizobium sp.]